MGSVYQLPFGSGQRWLNVGNGFLSRVISGWETSLILQIQSGRPWDLHENIEWINPDAYLNNIQWKGADQSWAFRTHPVTGSTTGARAVCSARRLDNGQLQLIRALDGCTLQNVDIIRRATFGGASISQSTPRLTSFRSSTVRLHSPATADLSFNKQTKITETKTLQFRLEMFNFTNTYSYRVRQFTNDPDNINFGSIFLRDAGNTEVGYPRHIQLALKFIF